MESFSFIHAADLHLDSPFVGLTQVSSSVRKHFQESTFLAFQNLCELAIEKKVNFIILSGDIYDLQEASLRAQLFFQKMARKLEMHKIAVYLIHGNHDPILGRKVHVSLPDNVVVFPSDQVHERQVFSKGQLIASISGISYEKSSVTDNLALLFDQVEAPADLYKIAILHANVESNQVHDNYAPCSLADLTGQPFDYWALGHIHKRNILSQNPFVIYPGNTQGRHIKESGPKGCYLVQVQGKHTTLTFCELDVVRWIPVEVSIQNVENEQELIDCLQEKIEEVRLQVPGKFLCIRFYLVGRNTLHAMLIEPSFTHDLLHHLQNYLAKEQVWIESLQIQTGFPIQNERLIEEDSFMGELFRLTEEMKKNPELLEEITGRALAPLMSNRKAKEQFEQLFPSMKLKWIDMSRELAYTWLSVMQENGGKRT